ncbi:MAG: hypothetical protein SWE60_08060 [Thermodesulfobacteriota bacterium]|nr:hypothetical protein [Thermodesulfobacteriota bacterium]
MFPLIETIIGFVVIMLVLSLLVKSLTSVVKNHCDYYSSNFKREVERFLRGTVKGGWDKWKEKAPWLDEIQWHRLREDFLTEKNMEWLLEKLDVEPKALKNLEARLEVHKVNIRFAFEKRTKNLSLAMGLALCLFMNINAFAIWETLYEDQQARAKFSSPEYVESALERVAKYDKKIAALTTLPGGSDAGEKQELEKQREDLEKQIHHFQGEVAFGIGKIWTGEVTKWGRFFYEFFGSLLTGILISIGAPYWHDLLKALTALRGLKKPEKAASAAG